MPAARSVSATVRHPSVPLPSASRAELRRALWDASGETTPEDLKNYTGTPPAIVVETFDKVEY